MYVDKQAEFSDSQAVTATAISTNVYDLYPRGNAVNTNVTRDIGVGEDVYLVVQCDTTATAAGAATVTVTLESSSTADLATAPTVHFASAALALANLTGGTTLLAIKLPAGSYNRYVGVRYTVGTGPLTAGAFSAFLAKDIQAFRAYVKGYNF
ncbi:Bbp16 family capsid cement protein [Pseudomonas guariconensis]|uniref:Bbp16 family capsid cement protein n=1 Tax=Pseudomonas guariconensis TaxID=1288410 RepID=UPI00390663EC